MRQWIWLLPGAVGVLCGSFVGVDPLRAQPLLAGADSAVVEKVGSSIGEIRLPEILNGPYGATLGDFDGKLIILDFWSTSCPPCLAAMPHMAEMQKRFAEKLQVVVIAWDTLQAVTGFYDRRPELKMLTSVGADNAAALMRLFGVGALGSYVWIDRKGVVRGITGSSEITPENIERAYGDDFSGLRRIESAGHKAPFDARTPFMLDGNTGGVTGVLSYSVLTPAMPGRGAIFAGPVIINGDTVDFATASRNGQDFSGRRVFQSNTSLVTMVALAATRGVRTPAFLLGGRDYQWYGWPRPRIVLESSDSVSMHHKSRNTKYCYEFIVAPGQKERLYDIMMTDLESKFDVTARVERRVVKALILVRVGVGPQTSFGDSSPPVDKMDFVAWDVTTSRLAAGLEAELNRPVVDETGVLSKVEIAWSNSPKKKIEGVRSELRKHGLDLIEADREIELLVIRDRHPIR